MFDISIPSKTQTYLAIGKPILMGVRVRGDAADLVRAAGAGIVFAPGQAAALAQAVDRLLAMPVSARQRMGGAGSLADIQGLIRRFGIIGPAAGSLFVFKGKYRAVLINYPRQSEKDALIAAALTGRT